MSTVKSLENIQNDSSLATGCEQSPAVVSGNSSSWLGFFQSALYAVFPNHCYFCQTRVVQYRHSSDKSHATLCRSCYDSLPSVDKWAYYACSRCGESSGLKERYKPCDASIILCANCQKKTPAFDRTIFSWLYSYPLDSLVRAYKSQGETRLLAPLYEGLEHSLAKVYPKRCELPDYLVCVPQHWTKTIRAKPNCARQLAQLIAQRFGIEMLDPVRKTENSSKQKTLSLARRRANLRNSFSLTEDAHQLAGTHIMLVDDVMTTGATLHTISKLLKQAGARKVDAVVLARRVKR